MPMFFQIRLRSRRDRLGVRLLTGMTKKFTALRDIIWLAGAPACQSHFHRTDYPDRGCIPQPKVAQRTLGLPRITVVTL